MGPFRLMDLIGIDINLAVSRSIYEAFHEEDRFRPSELQEEKVSKGELGKKTGKGFIHINNKIIISLRSVGDRLSLSSLTIFCSIIPGSCNLNLTV
jgi:3-hydroxyacyl-CoA dehydrogenase